MFARAHSGQHRLWSCATSFTYRYSLPGSSVRNSANGGSVGDTVGDNDLYLHVGPSGDFWTGSAMFAAKHLPPDYVKSIRLDHTTLDVDTLMGLLENDGNVWTRAIYDNQVLPQDLLDRLRELASDESKPP
jgi:hypothetical protein